MAALCISRVLCLFFFLVNVAFSANEDVSYDNYNLENEDICHGNQQSFEWYDHKNAKELSRARNSAIILKPDRMFDHWQRITNKHCRFVFKVHSTYKGLFAVIQKISFRRNGTECIDYVQFKRKDGHMSERFCGQMDNRKISYNSAVETPHDMYSSFPYPRGITPSPYADLDPKGTLETRIFVSKEPLNIDEKLDLMIVYTPYRTCSRLPKEDVYEFKSVGNDMCIWKEYVCDKYQNCAFTDCSDEASLDTPCSVLLDTTDRGTNVTISAVTTMFLCFIIFMMSLWICRKHSILCWSSDCAGPPLDGNVVHVERGAVGSVNLPVPTAPMLEVAVPSPVKDLPPSYDSLFPQQSSNSNT